MQSSASRDSTCLVSVEINVKRKRSCCSEGRELSFLMSSSGVLECSDDRDGGGSLVLPLVGVAAIAWTMRKPKQVQ